MSKFNRVLSAIETMTKWFYLFSAICLIALFAIMTIDVLGRFLFNKPLVGTMDVGTYLLAALIFLGLGYAQVTGRHVKLDILTKKFPDKLRRALNASLLVLSLAFFAMMTRQTAIVAYSEWKRKLLFSASAVNLPIWVISFAASLGCIMLAIALIVSIIRLFYTAENVSKNS